MSFFITKTCHIEAHGDSIVMYVISEKRYARVVKARQNSRASSELPHNPLSVLYDLNYIKTPCDKNAP